MNSFKPLVSLETPMMLLNERQIYRNRPCSQPRYQNLMFEPRVVRGLTFKVPHLQQKILPDDKKVKARKIIRKDVRIELDREGTRKHEEIQTEKYLESISESPDCKNVDCQTDLFLDSTPAPQYCPAKTGIDTETQIYEGDLFDFDVEVTPLLNVLVHKTLEQSLTEVLEEDEIALLQAQKETFLARKFSEEQEVKRLEEKERRYEVEVNRRIEEQKQQLENQKQLEARIAAASLTEKYLKDLIPTVISGLCEAGYFVDNVRSDVEEGFIPWLMEKVKLQINVSCNGKSLLDQLICHVIKLLSKNYSKFGRREDNHTIAKLVQNMIGEAIANIPENNVQEEKLPTSANDTNV